MTNSHAIGRRLLTWALVAPLGASRAAGPTDALLTLVPAEAAVTVAVENFAVGPRGAGLAAGRRPSAFPAVRAWLGSDEPLSFRARPARPNRS